MAEAQLIEKTTEKRDSFLHVLACDFQWLLRVACLLALLATVITMATFWFWAVVPAIVLLFLYAMLLIADGIEHRTDTIHRLADQTEPEQQDAPVVDAARQKVAIAEAVQQRERAIEDAREHDKTVAVEKRLTRIAVEVLCGALIIGGTAAYITFGWKMLPIAALVFVGYCVLVTTPVWLAWMEKDMQEESLRHRLR